MLNSHTMPSRSLRNNYREVANLLSQHDHVVITNNGVGESVLINMDVFAQFEDYLHRGFVYEELQKSKAKLADPNVQLHDADEVHDELEQILEAHGL